MFLSCARSTCLHSCDGGVVGAAFSWLSPGVGRAKFDVSVFKDSHVTLIAACSSGILGQGNNSEPWPEFIRTEIPFTSNAIHTCSPFWTLHWIDVCVPVEARSSIALPVNMIPTGPHVHCSFSKVSYCHQSASETLAATARCVLDVVFTRIPDAELARLHLYIE